MKFKNGIEYKEKLCYSYLRKCSKRDIMALALMDLETLEMARKRDHKIMITDGAIEKVPYVYLQKKELI